MAVQRVYSPGCTNWRWDMAAEFLAFDDLILAARCATFSLNGVSRRDGPRVAAAPANNAKRVDLQLTDSQSRMLRLK